MIATYGSYELILQHCRSTLFIVLLGKCVLSDGFVWNQSVGVLEPKRIVIEFYEPANHRIGNRREEPLIPNGIDVDLLSIGTG